MASLKIVSKSLHEHQLFVPFIQYQSIMIIMKRNKKFFILPLILLILMTGCTQLGIPMDTLPWVSNDPIYFKDSFEVTSGGWMTFDDDIGYAGYDGGGFRIWAGIENYQFWSVPGLNFKDTIIHVRAKKISGPENNLFGVMCRYQDDANYYAIVLGSDGYYGIFKTVEGQQSLIAQKHMDFSAAIQQGNSENEIQAVCQGEHLLLIVNGERLLHVTDGSLSQGDVGLIVGNFSEPGTEIIFDNFIVAKP